MAEAATRLSAATRITVATAVSGIAGYVVTALVYRSIGAADYAEFATFWGALYLLVGALSGIQQEITRATRPIPVGSRHRANRARDFGVLVAVLVAVAVAASAPLWAPGVLGRIDLAWPLAVGAAGYVLVAVLSGSLTGIAHWRALAAMIAADGLLRLVLVAGAVVFSDDPTVLAWAVVAPFPLVILLVWPFIRRGFIGRSDIDVGLGELSWNSARTVLAAAATALIVSGFPLLLGATSQRDDPALVGELIFTLTLSRAPVVITVMGLQSFLIVQFRHRAGAWRFHWMLQAGIAAFALVLAGLAWLAGPTVLDWVGGADGALDGSAVAALVASSALVGMVTVSGAATLARSDHRAYATGWLLAALVTASIMLSPIDLMPRVLIALIAGPLVGLAVHGIALSQRRHDKERNG